MRSLYKRQDVITFNADNLSRFNNSLICPVVLLEEIYKRQGGHVE